MLIFFSGLAATTVVYTAVRCCSSDTALSIVPGWHATIYPPEILWVILTILIITTSVVVYLVFKLLTRLFLALWKMIAE